MATVYVSCCNHITLLRAAVFQLLDKHCSCHFHFAKADLAYSLPTAETLRRWRNRTLTEDGVGPLKSKLPELHLNIQSVPRSKHSASVIKTSQLMLYREIIAVCSQIHTKHINTLCGRKVGFV